MNKTQQLHKLYGELKVVNEAIANFPVPHSAARPRAWTDEEADQHAYLVKQQAAIRSDIAQWEATPD